MDLPPALPIVVPPLPSDTPCPFLVVLRGRECGCPVRGAHAVHRYRAPDGTRHEFELVDLDG
jgi:hypothetical protein